MITHEAAKPGTPELGLSADIAAIHASVRSHGVPAQELRAAVLVTHRSTSVADACARALPRVQQTLVLVPWVSGLRESSLRRKEEVSVTAREGYSLDTYLAIARFLIERTIPLDAVLVHVDEACEHRAPALIASIRAAIVDLFIGNGSKALPLIPADARFHEQLCVDWGDYLLAVEQPLHALKFFYYALRWRSAADMAVRCMECLVDMQCTSAIALDWATRLPMMSRTKVLLRSKLAQAMRMNANEQLSTLQANLGALAMTNPRLANAQRVIAPTQAHIGTLGGVPWQLDARTRALVRGPRSVLFQVDDDDVTELVPPRDPRRLIPVFEHVQNTRHRCGILVGTIAAVDDLLNLPRYSPALAVPSAPTIYIVEENPALLALVLRIVRVDGLLGTERVHCFAGPHAVDELRAALVADPSLVCPNIFVSATEAQVVAVEELRLRRRFQGARRATPIYVD